MSITLQWDNSERSVIRMDCDGRWSAGQLEQAFEHAMALARGVGYCVYLLGIVRQVEDKENAGRCHIPVTDWPANLCGVVFVDAPADFREGLQSAYSDLPAVTVPDLFFVTSIQQAYERLTVLHLESELHS